MADWRRIVAVIGALVALVALLGYGGCQTASAVWRHLATANGERVEMVSTRLGYYEVRRHTSVSSPDSAFYEAYVACGGKPGDRSPEWSAERRFASVDSARHFAQEFLGKYEAALKAASAELAAQPSVAK